MTEIQEWFEQYQRQVRGEAEKLGLDKGEKLGFDKGRAQAIARLFERRLGRPLAEGERRGLAERIERLGEDRVDDVLLGLDAGALAAWLADPAAS